MEKKIINSLYEKYNKIIENKEFLDVEVDIKDIQFNNFNIADKIKLARYCNFIYSYKVDRLLNNMDNIDIIIEKMQKEEGRKEFVYDIFQLNKNVSEKFFINLFEYVVNQVDFETIETLYSFLLKPNKQRTKFLEILYYSYFLVFDYFNDYNLFYLSEFKPTIKYLYSSIFFEKFIDKKFSNDTIYYLNLSRFISTSYDKDTALNFYFNNYTKTNKLLFKFDINKVKQHCKLFDFNNDFCINFKTSKFLVQQQTDKEYIKEHQEFLDKTILLYSMYKTMNPKINFSTFYNKYKDNDEILFLKQSYSDILDEDVNFDKLIFTDKSIQMIRHRLKNSMPFNKSIYRSKKLFNNKIFSSCSLFDEKEVLLLPNEDIFIKIDTSKIKSYKIETLTDEENIIYYIEDSDDYDLFVSSDEIIKSLETIKGGSIIQKKLQFINFSVNQLQQLFNKNKLIDMYLNNNIIYKEIFYNDLQYKYFKDNFLKIYQNINFNKNNLLKGGNKNYKQKYLSYKSKYLNLKNNF